MLSLAVFLAAVLPHDTLALRVRLGFLKARPLHRIEPGDTIGHSLRLLFMAWQVLAGSVGEHMFCLGRRSLYLYLFYFSIKI